jgi:hypothetical protein
MTGNKLPLYGIQVIDVSENPNKNSAHRLCVAPMMDWTDFIERNHGQVHRGTPRLETATP